MEEFTPIETQEAFDAAVQERVDNAVKQFENWLSPEKANEFQAQINGLQTENLRLKIAQETGLPSELAARLTGTTEEEIRKDAELLSKFSNRHETPSFTPEKPPAANPEKAAFTEMLQNLMK